MISTEAQHVTTVERVLDVYRSEMQRACVDPCPVKEGCVEGVVGNAANASLYALDEDAATELYEAAYRFAYLVKAHCFHDGNKRVSWATLMFSLAALGVTVKATDDEAVDFTNEMASISKPDVQLVLGWLVPRLRAHEA